MKNLMVAIPIVLLMSLSSYATICKNTEYRKQIDITADPSSKNAEGVDINIYSENGSLKVYSSTTTITESTKTYTLKAYDGSTIKATFFDQKLLMAPATVTISSVTYTCPNGDSESNFGVDENLPVLQKIAGGRYQYNPASPAFDRTAILRSKIQDYMMSLQGVNGITQSACHRDTGDSFSSLDFNSIDPSQFEHCLVISTSTTQSLTALQRLMPPGYRYEGVLITEEFIGEIVAH